MWDCMRRDSSRSHHQFACATSNMTGKSMEWLRQVATNYGIPMESRLPMMNFGDFGQRMPFAEESLDFIYSQHALNKLPSPRTHFAPFMSEIARLLRPNGTALLQLIPCCLPRTRALKYGDKVVYSGSDSYKFEIIDDRLGCEAAGLERVTIFRAPEADPESEAQGPYAFVLLARKGVAIARCPTEGSPSPGPARGQAHYLPARVYRCGAHMVASCAGDIEETPDGARRVIATCAIARRDRLRH